MSKFDAENNYMKKSSPCLFDDEADLYSASPNEVEFALNSRKIIDFNYGERFNEVFSKKMGLDVGFLYQTYESATEDEYEIERFFLILQEMNINTFFAIPTGYVYPSQNRDAMEVCSYDPALIGKFPSQKSFFEKTRGSQIGLYSNKYFVFSKCLKYSILDWNGKFTFFLGPRGFIEEVMGKSVESSWSPVKQDDYIDPEFLPCLRNAINAYGY